VETGIITAFVVNLVMIRLHWTFSHPFRAQDDGRSRRRPNSRLIGSAVISDMAQQAALTYTQAVSLG
jgi:hypothetical protein